VARTRKAYAVLAIVCLAAASLRLDAQNPVAPADKTPPTWSLAAVGDALIATRLAQFNHQGDPGFFRMAKIIQDADVAFLNLEGSLFDFSEFKGWAEVEHGGFWQTGPPEAGKDLKAMGFDLFNTANNHTTDWGIEGMRLTHEHLNRLGVAHSGSGMNLGEASRPAYLDLPKGRVALIGLATTFTPMSRAGRGRDPVRGRPGLNALRVDRTYEADPATFKLLASAAEKVGGRAPQEPGGTLRIFGVSVTQGTETRVVERLNQNDEERILREVRNAAKLADFVIVNSHSHEPGNDGVVPPPWLVAFAKKCIDAGAATYIVHGPHQLRGIEVYKNRPIFYSLADFIFHEELYEPLPDDMYEIFGMPHTALQWELENVRFKGGTIGFPSNPLWYESVVAVPTFKGLDMIALKLYPIDLARTAPVSQRGTPRMADEATGRKIIERLASLSAKYGTRIVYEDGVGVWRPGGASSAVK
jgi:poly-gamma-glutamate capsule biosynthesis protein CapA/YwtB (metallophosphatase superfamily)